jgi:hypothetical protein
LRRLIKMPHHPNISQMRTQHSGRLDAVRTFSGWHLGLGSRPSADSHSGTRWRSLRIITFPLRCIGAHTLDRPSSQIGKQGSVGPRWTLGWTLCPSQMNHCHSPASILDGEKHVVAILAPRKSLSRQTEQRMPRREFALQLALHSSHLDGVVAYRVPGHKPLHFVAPPSSNAKVSLASWRECLPCDSTPTSSNRAVFQPQNHRRRTRTLNHGTQIQNDEDFQGIALGCGGDGRSSFVRVCESMRNCGPRRRHMGEAHDPQADVRRRPHRSADRTCAPMPI